jgi:hypothetical protein
VRWVTDQLPSHTHCLDFHSPSAPARHEAVAASLLHLSCLLSTATLRTTLVVRPFSIVHVSRVSVQPVFSTQPALSFTGSIAPYSDATSRPEYLRAEVAKGRTLSGGGVSPSGRLSGDS